ncbi:hypothetical protein AAG906_021112 [Vitis piasezkii]
MVSIPADISRLSNLKVLLVRQCERLQKIPKLPPRIKLLDACDCTSLMSLPTPSRMISLQHRLVSTWLRPVEFMLWNCTGLYQDHVAMALETSSGTFPEIGYSIVIPGSRIPKWRWHENMGASVSATLPPHWLDNNFSGVALCAVFALEEGETIQRPGEIRCNFECREGPYFSHSITWTHSGDRVVETDHVCMMYQPRTQFVKSKSTHASVFKHIKASFSLSGASHEVKKCAIRLIYAPNTSGIATGAESRGRDERNVDEGTKSGFGGVRSFSPTHPGPNFTLGGNGLTVTRSLAWIKSIIMRIIKQVLYHITTLPEIMFFFQQLAKALAA